MEDDDQMNWSYSDAEISLLWNSFSKIQIQIHFEFLLCYFTNWP